MAEGNQDLVQSEASKLDDFEENKKDSVDFLLGPTDVQENAGGEGENAIATEVNANNLAARLAKAKKNRNRNRKRRNKTRESSLNSNKESNDTLVDTDAEDTKVGGSVLDSSDIAQDDNFEIKQIVVGSSSNTFTEFTPEEDEDSFHSGLENQSLITEQNNITELNNEGCDPIVSSANVEVSKPTGTQSIDFGHENAFEIKHVVVDVSSNILKESVVECEPQVEHSVLQGHYPDQDINETCSDEYESCANSASVDIIYQSEGVTITEIENVESEDTVLSNIKEEAIEAMNKLNKEWDSLLTYEDCLNNNTWSDNPKPGNNFFDQDLDSEILNLPSSSSHIHLKAPNPSIERLEGQGFNSDGIQRSGPGAKSLFRNESDCSSAVAPFNTDVNEILQQACIKVEQEIKSDPAKWGAESVQHSTSTEVPVGQNGMSETELYLTESAARREINLEEMKMQDVMIDYYQTKENDQKGEETFHGFNNKCKTDEVGISDFVIDMENEDTNIKVKAVVDISSEDDFIQKVIDGNSSDNLIERTSQIENVESDFPISANDINDDQYELYPNTPSVNILYQSEDVILQETEAVQSEAAVHFYARHPEVANTMNSEAGVFASYEDRLNNNYWPQDTKSEINLHSEDEKLETVNAVYRSIEVEEILPIASPKLEPELQSKPSLNVWNVDSSIVMQAINKAKTENQEGDKEGKKWSWKNLFPCTSNGTRSKSKDRNRSHSVNKLDEEGKRKKRGSSLPRFLDRKRNEKTTTPVADETPKSIDPPR